jgi:hypothetical protein
VNIFSPTAAQMRPVVMGSPERGSGLRSIQPSRFPINNLPPFLHQVYASSAAELAAYDALIRQKIHLELGVLKLSSIEVVVGIPFYTEIANIHSVLVTMREVFQKRGIRALFAIVGEFARQDMVQQITDCGEIEAGEGWEKHSTVTIETMWKPHPKYASKPWTVRALQLIAAHCGPELNTSSSGGGAASTRPAGSSGAQQWPLPQRTGAHLLIMDADIQFNHWELSAHSLVNSLLDPLLAWDQSAQALLESHLKTPKSNLMVPERPRGVKNVHGVDSGIPKPPPLSSREMALYPSPLPKAEMGPRTPGGNFLGESEIVPLVRTFSPIFAHRSAEEYPPEAKSPPLPSDTPQDPTQIKSRPPPANFVVLNAPRSFFADDAIVHLVSYLFTFMTLGIEVHQGHGGEFSMHRDLNKLFLKDDTIVYDRAYCVEQQMAHRAAFLMQRGNREGFPLPSPSSGSGAAGAGGSGSGKGSTWNNIPDIQAAAEQDSEFNEKLERERGRGCSVLEVLMKGKWHAKITLGKLLTFEGDSGNLHALEKAQRTAAEAAAPPAPQPPPPPQPGQTLPPPFPQSPTSVKVGSGSPVSAGVDPAHNPSYPGPAPPQPSASGAKPPLYSRARIDLVTEKLFNDSMYFSSAGLLSPGEYSTRPVWHHSGGRHYIPNPDPKAQSLKVLAPTSTRKQMVESLKSYYQVLLVEHVNSPSGRMNLPIESQFIQAFLPQLHRLIGKKEAAIAFHYIVTHARPTGTDLDPGPWHHTQISPEERANFLIFGPEEWAKYTIELLRIYRNATKPEER